jgi:hypothetical protein
MVVCSERSDDTLSSGSDSGIETGEGFWNEGRKPARIYRGIPDGIPVSYSSDKVSGESKIKRIHSTLHCRVLEKLEKMPYEAKKYVVYECV